jgi:hypothetical protein
MALVALALALAGLAVPVTAQSSAQLSVSDQVQRYDRDGTVDTVRVERVRAFEDYHVVVNSPNGKQLGQSQVFEANQTKRNLQLQLDAGLRTNTRVTVEVQTTDGAVLATTEATILTAYRPRVRLRKQEYRTTTQTGLSSLNVTAATADERFYLGVYDEDGLILNTTRDYRPGTILRDLTLQLRPVITSDTTITVRIFGVEGSVLASKSARVSVAGDEHTRTVAPTRTRTDREKTQARETRAIPNSGTPTTAVPDENTPTRRGNRTSPGGLPAIFGLATAFVSFLATIGAFLVATVLAVRAE